MKRYLALALLPMATASAGERVSVAAAANLTYVMKPIDAAFEAANPGVHVEVTVASSGSLVAMIDQGAPFDVFLSADLEYPQKLAAAHHAVESSQVTFAFGKLVLWTTKPGLDLSSIPAAVRSSDVHKLAIANPRTAPYGEAAEQVLAKLHLSDVAAEKIVFGENISQTAQFVASGNADAGFVALSLVLAPTLKDRGRWIEVPTSMHTPLAHAGVLTLRGAHNPAAQRYLDFLGSPAARALFQQFGYGVPERNQALTAAPVGVAVPGEGWLMIHGGGVVSRAQRQKFISLAGGTGSNFVVLPGAAGGAIDVAEVQATFAKNWGVAHVTVLHTRSRAMAESEAFVAPLLHASGVWIPGGRQWRLADAYAGTRTESEIRNVLRRGGVVGGSSAGATIIGSFLVRGARGTLFNRDGDASIMIAPGSTTGFGLLPNTAIDQHINTRGRTKDLDEVIALHPELLGIGLNEGTAIIVHERDFVVMGRQAAVHDGKQHGAANFFFVEDGQHYTLPH